MFTENVFLLAKMNAVQSKGIGSMRCRTFREIEYFKIGTDNIGENGLLNESLGQEITFPFTILGGRLPLPSTWRLFWESTKTYHSKTVQVGEEQKGENSQSFALLL